MIREFASVILDSPVKIVRKSYVLEDVVWVFAKKECVCVLIT